ncbi:hypothetical protein GK047_02835 [Paenibacillus sp. SYP-B3998]|uniref:Uncharacterized protein n=1 Tax=Paenibacillus sp. SYP-B3998 TaxID=2678564 RepID=A0A6G3ZRX4_9BACL|nr:hypothetical protein [Paenibacillus sp. SYP-B3998]NEW04953.1 hypothetical protein [Paenibacillus sp. SYP-B3998]
MSKKTAWKLFTYVPFVLIFLGIGTIHTLMLANEKAKPYPASYGRATALPHLAANGKAVQPIGEGAFAYRSGQSLVYVSVNEEGRQVSQTRPLPDNGSFRSYTLTKEDAVWIGADKKLFASEWKDGAWSPKQLLSEIGVSHVQAVNGANGSRLLLAYNEDNLYVGAIEGKKAISWSKLDIAGISQLQGVIEQDGSLGIVYAANQEGKVAIGYAKLEAESLRPLQLNKLKDVELTTSKLDDMSIIQEGTSLKVAYTISSNKSGKSALHLLSFPSNRPETAQDEQINLPVSKGVDSDTVLHPTFSKTPSGEGALIVSSVYEKNRRLTSQEVYKLDLKEGKLSSSERLSHFDGFAEYPILISGKGHGLAVWLAPENAGSFRVYYATDQLPYLERMNTLTAQDYRIAAETLPLLWGIGLLTALLSLKWIVLPGLYLLVLSAFWQYLYDSHAKLNFGLSLGMYFVVKVLLINDYRKPLALQVMPDFLQSTWGYLLLYLIFGVLAYAFTRIWRKGLDERNIGLELLYFVLLDGLMTNLWYSYFISPAFL